MRSPVGKNDDNVDPSIGRQIYISPLKFYLTPYFFNGKDLSKEADLLEISEKIGITANEMQLALTDESYAYAMKQDVQEADALGIRGVPFFVFNRKYGVSGAQPVQAFIDTINQVIADAT